MPTLFRWTPELFQSTPAIAGGRILVVIPSAASSFLFQSTPAIAGGRIGPAICSRLGWRGFNPRPPLLAGESRSVGKNLCIFAVSIHARHCWRANRWTNATRALTYVFQSTPAIAGGRIGLKICSRPDWRGFNPRPPLLAGESLICLAQIAHCLVSIHARHCWRANLRGYDDELVFGLFQSTPAIAGGRIYQAARR